ncbi:MAG TPA: segregation/condensation protein A [Polyangia bacterium]
MTEVRTDESYRVALPEFEGPLDLLLHLCKTHEIEIVNIPIAFITEKYLEYLDVMQSLPVDVAADYLVMAATLAYLKSRELVPTPEAPEAAEEALDPREELIRRLLEYQKYKNAAALLGERPIEGRNIFGRGMEIDGDNGPAPLADHSAWKLIEAFGKLLEKAGPKVTHNVIFDRVSISSRINQVIDRLELRGGALRFDELFDLSLPEPELRSQLVVTLLAMLELARLRVVRVLASDDQETLIIAQVEGAALDKARRAKLSSDAESVADSEAEEVSEEAFDEEAPTAVVTEEALVEEVLATEALVEEAPADGALAEEAGAEGAPEVEARDAVVPEDAEVAFPDDAPTVVTEEVALSDSGAVLAEADPNVEPSAAEPSAAEPSAAEPSAAGTPASPDPAIEERHEET